MQPARLHDVLTLLDWSQQGIARQLAMNDRQVRRWASGDTPIPQRVAEWLETLAAFHEQHPPPIKLRQTAK